MTRTELTAEQSSELVVVLEAMRAMSASPRAMWLAGACSDWCLIYLVQWFHKIGPLPDDPDALSYACAHMVAELCEERCETPEWQTDVQAAFGGIVQTPQC